MSTNERTQRTNGRVRLSVQISVRFLEEKEPER